MKKMRNNIRKEIQNLKRKKAVQYQYKDIKR